MAKNANYVSHKKSKLKENGGPKLPLAADLVEGEIAINFGKDVETLSIKNESGDVVTFSSDNYYTEKKLGSGFTGENSAVTVTDVIKEVELVTSSALNDLEERKLDSSAYTPTVELWVSGTGENAIVQKGGNNTASGNYSVAEGSNTTASGYASHAEGNYTKASGNYSHAEGIYTTASGYYSHAEGNNTITLNNSEHASGQYNVSNSASTTFGYSGNTLFSVGNGTSTSARHNAFEIRQNGDIYLSDGTKLQDAIDITIDQVIDSGTSASTDAVSTSAVYGFVTSYTPSITVDQDFSNTASTNPISTKAVYSAVTDNELVWTNAFVALSGITSAHTTNTEIHVTAADKEKLHTHSNKTALDSITGNVGTMAYEDKASYSSATEVNTAFGNKVDKVTGKGLSTNDYTTDEKNKLSGIASGAEVNQNAFSNIKVGSTTVAADNKTDTLEISGSGIVTITADATNDKITISASNAVTSVAGKTGAVTLAKGDVGLGNVDNTADANKTVKAATSAQTADSAKAVALSGVSNADDLKAIEVLTGTSGLLKKTAANTWTLDTNSYSTTAVAVTGATYNSTNKTIDLKNAAGTVVSTVDATAFIKDGMVSNVEVKNVASSGTCLVITFNTDSGKDAINIPISQIFDANNYYTKVDLTGSSTTVVVAKASSATTADSAKAVALSGVSNADDLKAIEALTGTSGLLKKTAANTWTLDTTDYSNKNAFGKIKINAESTTIDSDTTNGTLAISGGSFVTLTSDAANDKFTIGVSTGTSSSTLARGDHNHDSLYQAKGSYLTGTTKYAGASTQGGAATSAKKLSNTAAIGSVTNPVFFTANGVPSACTYSLNKTVPSDAVFTDTKVTSVSNHYAPAATSAGTKSATASSTAELNWGSAVVTGVTLSGDAKGHITSVTVASGKLKTPVTGVTLASGTNNGTVKLTVNGTATDNIAVKGLNTMAYQATSSYSSATQVNTALGNKVDKVTGKGLSTNDYTTDEKNKLSGIASGAEVNVQSDWNATSGDAFIKNKPTIPDSFQWFGTSSTSADTVQKEVSIPSITSLKTGQIIVVQPTVTSSVANSTLKLNNFDAYPMRYSSSAITTSTDSVVWNAKVPSLFVFDGSYWVFLGHGLDSNTTYSTMSVAEGTAGTATSPRTMRADYLKQIIQALAPQSDWNATSGDAVILNKPTIPSEVTESTVSGWGFTKNVGTITGIKMNGSSKGTSGVVNLGTVLTEHQDISGKVNISDIVSAITPSNSASTAPIATKVVAENELVMANALTYLDERKLDASAYTEVNASSAITSMAGYSKPANTSAIVTSDTLNQAVGKLECAFGGMKLQKITQAAYDALSTKDSNTLYVITD